LAFMRNLAVPIYLITFRGTDLKLDYPQLVGRRKLFFRLLSTSAERLCHNVIAILY
jgi:hypothetical protein